MAAFQTGLSGRPLHQKLGFQAFQVAEDRGRGQHPPLADLLAPGMAQQHAVPKIAERNALLRSGPFNAALSSLMLFSWGVSDRRLRCGSGNIGAILAAWRQLLPVFGTSLPYAAVQYRLRHS